MLKNQTNRISDFLFNDKSRSNKIILSLGIFALFFLLNLLNPVKIRLYLFRIRQFYCLLWCSTFSMYSLSFLLKTYKFYFFSETILSCLKDFGLIIMIIQVQYMFSELSVVFKQFTVYSLDRKAPDNRPLEMIFQTIFILQPELPNELLAIFMKCIATFNFIRT